MIIVDLLYNLSVLIALSVLSGFINIRFKRTGLNSKLLQGLLFGFTAIVGMANPFIFTEGIIFDGRSVVISLCTLFFGPVSGSLAAAAAIIYRIYLGGVGTLMGILVIASSFLIGLLFYTRRNNSVKKEITTLQLYLFGLLVHVCMLALVLLLPAQNIVETYKMISLTVLGIYPLVSVLTGKILLDQEENQTFLEKIGESEKLFRTTLYSIADAVITTDPKGRIRQMNPIAEQLTGWKEEEARDKPLVEVFKIITEDTLLPVFNPVNKIIKEGEVLGQTNHTLLISKDKKQIPIADSGSPIMDQENKIIGVVLVFRDQTEQREKERILNESEERFRSLYENSTIGLYRTTPNGQIILANPTLVKMLGYHSFEELVRKDLEKSGYVNQMKRNTFKTILEENGIISGFESEWFRQDGTVIYVKESAKSVRDKTGKTKYYDGTVEDITERKRAEIALNKSEWRYRDMIENLRHAYYEADWRGAFTYCNPALVIISGYSEDELIGKSSFRLVADEHRKKISAAYKRWQHEMTKDMSVEFLVKTKTGKKYWVEQTTHFIFTDDGNFVKATNVVKDITERKLAEKRLKESESSYRGLFNSVSEAIYVLDENGFFIDVNDGALKMYGYSKEELVGKTPEFVSAEGKNDLPKVAEMLGKAFNGENQVFEFWGKRKDGSAFLKEVRLYPGKYLNKVVTIALAQDITQRKRSEIIQNIQYNIAEAAVTTKSLNELFEVVRSELSNIINVKNFFIALYNEQTGMLISDVDEDEMDNISEWPAKNSMTGYVIETQKSILLTKAEINKMIETGVTNMIGIIPEVWLGVPFKISGKVIGVLVVQSYHNVNEYDNSSKELLDLVAHELSLYIRHKRAEELTSKLSTAIVQSPVSIMITDSHGDIEYVNPKFIEVSGYNLEEVRGQNPRILNAGYRTKTEYKEMWTTILTGKEWRGEFYNKKKNGELYWESATISPIINSHGEITNFIALKEDITAQKRMTEELIAAKEKAEEMNRVKSYFYANMSHELRTPFVGILGYSELLYETLQDQEQREMANQILNSSKRLTETLNKVLDITKLEFDKIEPGLVDTDLFQLIKNLQDLFNASAEKKLTKIKTEFNCKPFNFKTDEKLLREILTNLINNAIKFTYNGVITISVELSKIEQKNNLIIKVTDTGVGIPKEKQEIIWLEFRQASEGFNRSFEGTGLGLTIVRKYTEMLGGQVFVESEVGKGSVFRVELPIIIEVPETEHEIVIETTTGKQVPSVTTEIRPKILYVEDDIVSSEFVNVVLSKNYDIDTTPEAAKVLKLINETQYDILLIDINLGHGMDGVELTQLIRQNPNYENIPVIALTAYASNNDKEEFLSKGFSHYLAKPFTINQLKDTLKLALD